MLETDITALRPQLRPEVILGPAILSRGAFVHYMKDTSTNWFYRIGTREYFLVSRMDGSRTLQEIGAEYEKTTGKHLHENSWLELLQLLGKRQLLVGSETPDGLKDLKKAAQKKGRKERGIFRARIPLVNPDAFLGKVLPWLSFAFHPVFVFLALAAILALEVFIFSHLNLLIGEVVTSFRTGMMVNGQFAAWLIVLVVVVLATHELSHGLACKRFGGSAQEIGIGWRYLCPFPYCKLDDVVLFQNRWHRVYTAFAGVFINLLMLLPFLALWYFTPEFNFLKAFCAVALLAVNVVSLLNLMPFIELDGYLMVTYALNMTDLHKDAYDLYQNKIVRFFIKGTKPVTYAQRSSVYLTYGAFSFIITTCFVIYMAVYWFGLLRFWVGGIAVWPVFLAMALLLLLLSKPGRNWVRAKKKSLLMRSLSS